MRGVAAAVLLATLLAGCMQTEAPDDAGALDARIDRALGFLGTQRTQGRWAQAFARQMVETAHDAGKDPRHWPEGLPLSEQVDFPGKDDPFLGSLRGYHAATLLGDPALQELAGSRVRDHYDGRQFGDPALLNDDAYSLLVLEGAGGAIAGPGRSMAASLLENQSSDGGWSWSVGGVSETDVTGLVLVALQGWDDAWQGAPSSFEAVDQPQALRFLDGTSRPGGGHALEADQGAANCDSTVWAIRAYAVLGQPPGEGAWAFLLGLQNADGGFAYLPGGPSNTLCTAEAASLLGLAASGTVPGPTLGDG